MRIYRSKSGSCGTESAAKQAKMPLLEPKAEGSNVSAKSLFSIGQDDLIPHGPRNDGEEVLTLVQFDVTGGGGIDKRAGLAAAPRAARPLAVRVLGRCQF